MAIGWKQVIVDPVADHIFSKRFGSLCGLSRFKLTGIEAWLKVETIAAIGSRIDKLCNKGPDLDIRDQGGQLHKLELKAATDLNPSWLKESFGNQKQYPKLYQNFLGCLFLGHCSNEARVKRISDPHVILDSYRAKRDDDGVWVVGLLVKV